MHPDAPYFSILVCLMPDNFTSQGESAPTQWVNMNDRNGFYLYYIMLIAVNIANKM